MPHRLDSFGPVLVMSGTAVVPGTYYTQPVWNRDYHRLGFQIPYTDTAAFDLKLETTMDPRAKNEADNQDYIDHTDGGVAQWYEEDIATLSGTPAGTAGSLMFHFENINSAWSRMRIEVSASGTIGPVRAVGKR